jgi:hypothetical protein
MTVSSSTDRATFAGNGVATVFPLPFRFFANSDIQASLINNATGAVTPLTLGVNYSLIGAALPEQDGNAESVLTMFVAPAIGFSLFAQRVIPLTQPTDIVNQGRFFPETHEDVFDRLTMLMQQAEGNSRGAIRVAIGDPEPNRLPAAVQRAGKIMTFDASGNPEAVAPLASDAAGLAALLADSSNPDKGSALVGYKNRTAYARLSETVSVKDFGAKGDGVTDNTAALQAAAAYASALSANYHTATIVFPTGTYLYTTSPNWAISRLELRCCPGVVLKHTGAGNAVVFDGGQSGDGVFVCKMTGDPLIVGNISTTNGLYTRAVHNSKFEVRVRDVSVAALKTEFAVCNEYHIRCSPVGEPLFGVIPVNGISLGKRDAGETTSACTFYNPIIEGVSGYGISISDAVQNTFIGGTSESNAGGVFISSACGGNSFHGTDFEFNSGLDIFCQGARNNFNSVLSDSESRFEGTDNIIAGGLFNKITNTGTRNEYLKATYAAAGQPFIDTGVGTVKRSVVNLATGVMDAELVRNPNKLINIEGPAGNSTVIGSSDQLVGGSASDVLIYHYGAGELAIWANGLAKIRISGSGIGFNAVAPIVRPTITGAKAGNAALGSIIAALASYGLVIDSTT